MIDSRENVEPELFGIFFKSIHRFPNRKCAFHGNEAINGKRD